MRSLQSDQLLVEGVVVYSAVVSPHARAAMHMTSQRRWDGTAEDYADYYTIKRGEDRTEIRMSMRMRSRTRMRMSDEICLYSVIASQFAPPTDDQPEG